MITNPLRVCIDISAAVHRRAGLGRYAQELVKGLVDLRRDAASAPLQLSVFYHQRGEAILEPPMDQLTRLTTRLSVRPWRLRTALAYFTNIGMDRSFGSADVFHATEHLLPRLKRVRSVFTLHDLIFQFDPASHKPLNIAFLKSMMPKFLKQADAIIAVSESTKRDAIRLYGVPAAKIQVIYEGVDPKFVSIIDPRRLADIRRKYQLPGRFMLHLGTIEPRKNLPLLFEAIKDSTQQLVVAGKLGWLTAPILARVKELSLEERVHFTGFIEDEDLPALISCASLAAMPSKYEGFGLPVLEAMACGVPVIASNTSSLPEVGGDAALYARPDDTRSWVTLIDRVMNDNELRAEMIDRGLRQAQRFRWSEMARQTFAVYQETAKAIRSTKEH